MLGQLLIWNTPRHAGLFLGPSSQLSSTYCKHFRVTENEDIVYKVPKEFGRDVNLCNVWFRLTIFANNTTFQLLN